MLYPLPAVLVSVADSSGNSNLFTVAWAGTVCSDPVMVSISVRRERFSYEMISQTGEFVINLTTEALCRATDFCGVRSGRDLNKWEAMHLTQEKADLVNAPMVGESPVNLECRVKEIRDLGSHTMFLAEVVAVHAEEEYMDQDRHFHLDWAKPIVYSHGSYYALGQKIGTFGYSVKKQEPAVKKEQKKRNENRKDNKRIKKETG